jgi:hypothetical protein
MGTPFYILLCIVCLLYLLGASLTRLLLVSEKHLTALTALTALSKGITIKDAAKADKPLHPLIIWLVALAWPIWSPVLLDIK